MIELLIHLEVPSHNQLNKLHWSKRHKLGKQWEHNLRYTLRPGNLDIAKKKRSVVIRAFRKQRMPDEANFIAGANKTLVDALVRVGLLVDDSDKWAAFTYQQEVASKSPTGKVCTFIQIEDL